MTILQPHPEAGPEAALSLSAGAVREGGRLRLTYRLTGDVGAVVRPDAGQGFQDDLWRSTCFEAFLRRVGSSRYLELNFVPPGAWAAYIFDDYRTAKRSGDELRGVELACTEKDGAIELTASVPLPSSLSEREIKLGLSAVVEEASGRKSYWALAHPEGKPDFHHDDCFSMILPDGPAR